VHQTPTGSELSITCMLRMADTQRSLQRLFLQCLYDGSEVAHRGNQLCLLGAFTPIALHREGLEVVCHIFVSVGLSL
jgi:hypothetical protein